MTVGSRELFLTGSEKLSTRMPSFTSKSNSTRIGCILSGMKASALSTTASTRLAFMSSIPPSSIARKVELLSMARVSRTRTASESTLFRVTFTTVVLSNVWLPPVSV